LAAFGDTRPYIMLAAPLRDGGIVAGLFDRDMLDDQLAQGRLGDTGDVYLVDFDGHLLVHTQPQGILNNTPLAQRPELDAALTASNHHWHGTYTNFVGDAVIGSTAAVEGTNWIVFTEVAEAEAFATSRSAIVFLVVVLTVIEIIILFPSLLATQTNLFRPIESLRAGAEKVEQGDLNVQVKIVKADEIGEVTAAFNRMVAALRQRNTELRQARDEALAARHMAEESARLKSEFLSTMSHELRTPLNAIEGFSSIMLSGMGVELDPKAHSMVERIGANSKRLLDLINDFVDLLRIEAGRVELVEKPLSPAKLAERWASQMSVLAERKQLEFIVQVDEQLPTELLSDEDALTKITLNLLSNAFKFTHKGTVTLALRAQQEKWTIEVSDTGIGIPPHAREYIFEEFRQVDGSSKRQYGGTGLGLAIVQKMTRLMGGTVTVNSEVGQGSTFTVTLPLKMYSETA
jgi:signal transduction histidine kinase